MGTCTRCLELVLFVFNFALWLLGCALLSVGIWLKSDDTAGHHVRRFTEKKDDTFDISYSATGETDVTVTLSYFLIVLGIILIIITFIGCCGALKENTCLLGVFAICLFVLMIALFTVGVWAYVKRENFDANTPKLRATTDKSIEKAIQGYYVNEPSKTLMDVIQEKFKCCGGNEADKDYGNKVPMSCKADYYGRRCTDRYNAFVGREIQDFMEQRFTIICAIALSVGVCVALGMMFSLLLCCSLRRSNSVRVS